MRQNKSSLVVRYASTCGSAAAPELSKEAGATETKGICVLKIIVEADGSTSHIRVVNGLAMGLDEKAIEAVKKWKFKPAMLKDKPVAVEGCYIHRPLVCGPLACRFACGDEII